MFGLFGGKKVELVAPVAGKIMDITEVPDSVFSTKMLGDGFAVEPTANCIVAPCDGKVVLLARTKHAVAIEKEGVQILIHIGLDTVELSGQGFTTHIKENDLVKQGDRLISFDGDYIQSQEKSLTTMLVLTNMEEKVKKVTKDLKAQNGTILAVTVKD